MKDISILACFGIKTDELENYEIQDLTSTAISLSVKKRRIGISCPNCGETNVRVKDYKQKHYFFRNINGYDVKVFYKQRRYVCPSCSKSFLEKNPFINNQNYKLSSSKIAAILQRLKENLSLKMIADFSGVSVSSVIKVLDKYYEAPVRRLPQILCIDEFMAFNSDSDFKYACLLLDFVTGEIINVIRSRQKKHLYPYFFNLPKEEKENVKILIMDMYKPYKDLAKYYLPNALVVIDPFHFVRYTVKAIDVIRINTMKAYKDDSIPYKMLQKYRRLLLKKGNPNTEKRKRVGILGGIWLNEKEILDRLLEYNPDLEKAYELGHTFLHNYSKFDYDGFKNFLRNTIERYKKSLLEDFIQVGKRIQIGSKKYVIQD